jgi:hypothetical protein
MNQTIESPPRLAEGDWVRLVRLPEPAPAFEPDAFNRRPPRVGDIAQVVDLREEAPEYELECRDGDRVEWLQPASAGQYGLEPCAAPDFAPARGKVAVGTLAAVFVSFVLSWLFTPWVRTLVSETGKGEAGKGLLELLVNFQSQADVGIAVLTFLCLFVAFLAAIYFTVEAMRDKRSERLNRR